MKRTKSLVASLVAIVICFAMLLGTTHAWFTDSVINTNTIIKSGNIDVELWHAPNGALEYEEVNGTTKLFRSADDKDIIWEPGASVTEAFKVKNAGSLALKYEFRVRALAKTETADGRTLADILTLSVSTADGETSAVFGNGYKVEDMLFANTEDDYVITISWDKTNPDNNYYNVKDGLKIYLGIELVATQVSYEYDGSDNGFDDEADYPTTSNVIDVTSEATEEKTLATKGENAVQVTLPAQLLNSLDESVESVALFHTEPIINQEDDSVTFEHIELVNQNGDIIDLSNNDVEFKVVLPALSQFAGKPVKIYHDGGDQAVAMAIADADGVITYNVKHLCEVKVELNTINSNEELAKKIAEGVTDLYLGSGIYIIPDEAQGKTLSFIGNGDTIIATQHDGSYEGCDYSLEGATVTFKDITINTNSTTYTGYARLKATYENCTINGTYTLYDNSTFNGCTFNVSGDVYSIWTWGATNATFNKCTFNTDGKAILLYGGANTTLTVDNCTFNDNGGLEDLKAAIEVGNDYGVAKTLIVNKTIVNGYEINDKGINTGTTLWGNKNAMGKDLLNVIVDGVDVY